MANLGVLTDPWYEASFLVSKEVGEGVLHGQKKVMGLAGAMGLWLYCPCGWGKPDHMAHGLVIPFKNAPTHNFGVVARDGKTRPKWTATGTGLHDLTLHPSVDVGAEGRGCWHGFVRAGKVT